MDTHRLRYFLIIAEEGSISRAAGVLGIAQPALSRQVRLLEGDLGVTLFRRTSRGVQLTAEGEQLRATTAAPLRQLELAVRYAGSPVARVERGLHLGIPPTATGVLAVPLLGSLSAAFPRVTFRISVASTDQLVEDMLKGTVDVAMINPLPDDRLFYNDLLMEDLFIVGGPKTDLRPHQALAFSELAELPLVLPGSRTGIRNSVEKTALRLKVGLTSRFSTDSFRVAKDLIESDFAYGILPYSACRTEIEAGRLRHAPLRDPALTHRLGLAVTSQLELPRGFAAKVGDIIREETARLIKTGTWAARLLPPRRGDG
ncbi:LysR family transcriptional regulator [Streptomyces galilaeus]